MSNFLFIVQHGSHQFPRVGDDTGHRRGRGCQGAGQHRTRHRALTPLEIAVARGNAVFSGRDPVAVHREACGASRLTKLEARLAELLEEVEKIKEAKRELSKEIRAKKESEIEKKRKARKAKREAREALAKQKEEERAARRAKQEEALLEKAKRAEERAKALKAKAEALKNKKSAKKAKPEIVLEASSPDLTAFVLD